MALTGIAALLYAGFEALAAVPAIISQMENLAGAITLWFVQQQNNQTLAAIADAAALASKAQTDADRIAAAQAWQTALSRPRVSVS